MTQMRRPVCSSCGTALPLRVGRGRPARYCSVVCRRAKESARRRWDAVQHYAAVLDQSAEAVASQRPFLARMWRREAAWERRSAGRRP